MCHPERGSGATESNPEGASAIARSGISKGFAQCPPTNIDFFRQELKIFSVRAIKNADGAKGIAKFFKREYNVSTGIMFPKIFDFKEN